MGIVIAAYSQKVFKEFLLPSLNDADYSIVLERQHFQLFTDVHIHMEVLDMQWSIKKDAQYTVESKDGNYVGQTLKHQDVLLVTTIRQEKITLFIKQVENVFHAYQKFDIRSVYSLRIGRKETNDIIYDYMQRVSRDHAMIEKRGDGYWILSQSSNGTYVNSVRLDGQAKLQFGDYINIMGLHMVFLETALAIDTAVENLVINRKILLEYVPVQAKQGNLYSQISKESQGKILYHRAPRVCEKLDTEPVEIEGPPEKHQKRQQSLFSAIAPSMTMALPMLLGCMMMIYASRESGASSLYMYSGLVMSLSSALVSVVWSVLNIRQQKQEEIDEEQYRFNAYSQYLIEKTDEIKRKYEDSIRLLENMYPTVNQCMTYDAYGRMLWNRNRTHEDFLTHRLGIGEIPFQIPINVPKKKFALYPDELAQNPEYIKENYKTLYQVPVTLDLMEHTVIGVVGGNAKKGALRIGRALTAQIAANNCYTDVKLGYLYDGRSIEQAHAWSFAKWLPHVWSEDKKTRFLASNREETADILYELTSIFRKRLEEQKEKTTQEIPRPYYVLFVSDLSLLKGELFSKYIFDKSGTLGLTTILMAERYEELPNDCKFIIQNDSEFQGMYDVFDRGNQTTRITFDSVDSKQLKKFAKSLSGLQVLELEEGGEIPESISFFEMSGVKRPEELPVRDLWAKNHVYENIRGMIGQKAGGVPCYLDVHEKYHGPHGLVAGTTGSGKSETLQTYMLSLAVNYSPDDIGFFIIDYKGGGMAHLFDGLPHMIGQISNLSGNQVKRAMVSIKSENRRRQRVFNENGVNNINAYTKLYKNGEAALPIPHLFIIIDEFAELKREEPDFMKELISVAQVGRSLGVHMILATQKPSGTVDDNIWSNSKFRLCLRVQDRQDSNDMLHKPDAAYITQAGRCYLQVGNDEVYELFQSGYSGAAYDKDAADEKVDIAKMLTLSGKVEMTRSMANASKKKKALNGKETTQLEAVKEYLAHVAMENGYEQKNQLWMPELPEQLYLEEFSEFSDIRFSGEQWKTQGTEWSLDFVLGKVDDPENQNQMPLIVDMAANGHIAICGNIVCGKSTMMQTMIYALIQKYTPDVLNIYGLDFSSKLMEAFESAPQVGGIMYDSDVSKIDKFFNMIENILKERKLLFRGGNYSQYVRVHGVTIPAIIVFIDNYAAFKEKTQERYEEVMIHLAKEGVNHGIYLVVSGTGFGMNDISTRVGENINTVLCLSLQDKYAYGDLLHCMQFDILPEAGIKGRGLAYVDGRILEYQTALAVQADNDYQRMDKIREICKQMSVAWKGKCARPVPEIPAKPEWTEFERLEDFEKMCKSPNYLPIGYDEANASVYGIPLREMYCYLIWGAAKTGKTNLLKACIESAMQKGSQICIIDDPQASLQSYKNVENICYVTDEDGIYQFFAALLPEFKKRNVLKQSLIQEDLEDNEIFDRMSKETPYFIFISDLSWFVPLVYNAEQDKQVSGFLENIIAKGSLHNIYFISELALANRSIVSGYKIYELFAGYKKGIHLGGKVTDNMVLNFDYLPFMEQAKSEKIGIGQIPDVVGENQTQKVVIPLVKKRKNGAKL